MDKTARVNKHLFPKSQPQIFPLEIQRESLIGTMEKVSVTKIDERETKIMDALSAKYSEALVPVKNIGVHKALVTKYFPNIQRVGGDPEYIFTDAGAYTFRREDVSEPMATSTVNVDELKEKMERFGFIATSIEVTAHDATITKKIKALVQRINWAKEHQSDQIRNALGKVVTEVEKRKATEKKETVCDVDAVIKNLTG